MKYKVEFWPYGEFDTAEAAERLNRRAGEGWELVNVVTLFVWGAFGMALYRRNPAAAEYRYATDILPNGNCEGYIDFCRDAGWEKVLKMDSGLCVFVSRDGRGQLLHTSWDVEYEHQLQAAAENYGSARIAPYMLLITAGLGYIGWMLYGSKAAEGDLTYRLVMAACGLIWLCQPLICCANLVYLKAARRRLSEGTLTQRPRWVAKLYGVLSVSVGILFAGMVFLLLFLELRMGLPLIVLPGQILLFLLIFAASVWINLFKNKADAAQGLMLAAFVPLVIPVLVS